VLTFRKEFKTGASYYGVSDLESLAKDTHKFESHYLDGLVGPYPARKDLYEARSPVHSAHLLSVPAAFFQGAEDKIVPPQQAEGHCQINGYRADVASGGTGDHAAETAFLHWFAASARKTRSVERETRWRWRLKVLWTAACMLRNRWAERADLNRCI
jgi:Prolyl oligopeptidase family